MILFVRAGDQVAGGRHGAMPALVRLFYTSETSAREHEAHTDQIIDRDLDQSARKDKKKANEEKEGDIEETVARCE